MLIAILFLLFVLFVASQTAYFIQGERLLRLLRSRYPDRWEACGRPSLFSWTSVTKRYWLPLATDSWYEFATYRGLNDPELRRRADMIRRTDVVTVASLVGILLLLFYADAP